MFANSLKKKIDKIRHKGDEQEKNEPIVKPLYRYLM
jgi:hypothetical protein